MKEDKLIEHILHDLDDFVAFSTQEEFYNEIKACKNMLSPSARPVAAHIALALRNYLNEIMELIR
jgi:hypothetical protein